MQINIPNSSVSHNAYSASIRVLRLEWVAVNMGEVKTGDVFVTLDQNSDTRGDGTHDGMWLATEDATYDGDGGTTVACEQLESKFVTSVPDLDVEVVYHLPQFLPYEVCIRPI